MGYKVFKNGPSNMCGRQSLKICLTLNPKKFSACGCSFRLLSAGMSRRQSFKYAL